MSRLAVEEIGDGVPLLALHGAFSAHEEICGPVERALAGSGLRRVYPDLPGMGGSPADDATSSARATDALEALVDERFGGSPFLLLGHSLGAHLARALAARRPEQVLGLALLCPLVPDDMVADEHVTVVDDGSDVDLSDDQREEYRSYLVVHTARTLARFVDEVVPALGRADEQATMRLLETASQADVADRAPYARPVLVAVGRHDATVGSAQHARLLQTYPRATALVLADAGHALPHEHPEILDPALRAWASAASVE